MAGDLYVHLLSGLHLATNSMGPNRIYATGGVRFWNDGRDVPDVMLATLDYPQSKEHAPFTLALRVNFASSEPQERFGFRFVGTEGTLTTSYNTLVLSKTPRETEPGMSIDTFPAKVQADYLRTYREKYPARPPVAELENDDQKFTMRADAHLEHHRNFQASVLNGARHIEDPVFGLRAAGPALLCNQSIDSQKIQTWDPVTMRVTT